MEFKIPKQIMEKFALPTLKKILKHFCAKLNSDFEQINEDYLPDHYSSFQYRRAWAKLRRLGYFVPECEQFYKHIIFDELNFYGESIYDFSTFNLENPSIETD
jgi:hypothetical protein